LNGDVGPFLTFLAGPAPPPPGTIGNPAANQTVTGSACGTNFFQVEGPGLPVGGVRTNQFSTLIGRRAQICGNGVLDPGEQCDLGPATGAPGSCCTANCTFAAAGTPCSDGNPCDVNGTCDGTSTVCPVTGFTTAPCTDGNVCTTADTCANGTCVGGPPPNCDDGNPCTSIDFCLNGQCLGGPPISCDDGNPCTDDLCDAQLGCLHVNNHASCSDGNACTANDTCSGGTCVGGPPPNCDDGNVCTA